MTQLALQQWFYLPQSTHGPKTIMDIFNDIEFSLWQRLSAILWRLSTIGYI